MSYVEISCGKFNSGWWETHLNLFTNPCEGTDLVVEKSIDSACLICVVNYLVVSLNTLKKKKVLEGQRESSLFTPLNFCLWGFLKSRVYSPLPATLNQLQATIPREGGCPVWLCHDEEGNAWHEGMGSQVHCCMGRTLREVEKWPIVSMSSHRKIFDEILRKCCPEWISMSLTCCKLQIHCNTLSEAFTPRFVKKSPVGFLINQKTISHSWFWLNSVFFRHPVEM